MYSYSISFFKLEEFAALWTISVRPLVGLWLVSVCKWFDAAQVW